MATVKDVQITEYSPYFEKYIHLVDVNTDLIEGYRIGLNNVLSFFKHVPKTKYDFAYADGKWSVKEVFQHLIDTERVFQYRCFSIVRGETKTLPGFNQDDYMVHAKATEKTMDGLIIEFEALRKNFIAFLESLNQTNLEFEGNIEGDTMSARAVAFIILGHYSWHINVLKTRYLKL
ncbi:MAG: DinB family protein [Aestuariibaculum sp.]